MFPIAAAFAVAVMIAEPPAIMPRGLVNTGEALAVLMMARAGDVDEANGMVGRAFRVSTPVAPTDWTPMTRPSAS